MIKVNATVGVIFAEHETDSTEAVAVVTNGLVVRPCVRLIRLCLVSIHLIRGFWSACRRVFSPSRQPTGEVLSVLQGTAGNGSSVPICSFSESLLIKRCRICLCKRFFRVDQ